MNLSAWPVRSVRCYRKCIIRSFLRRISTTSRCNSVKIAYKIYPDGSKPETASSWPIFVLHGLFGSKKNWHSLANAIASATNRIVVTMDARNHGDSEHDPLMNYPVMRDDLLGVMDRLKVERPILIGHSMGGKTIMTCALTKPERVSSLIVVDSAPRPSPGIESLAMYAQKMKDTKLPTGVAFLEGRRRVAEELKPFIKTEGELQFLMTNLKEAEDGSLMWRVNLDAVINNMNDLGSFPEFSSPCDITTYFIGGSLSRHLDDHAVPHVKRLFPKATIRHIPAAGHWVHSEKPAEFVAAVEDFILNVHKDS